MVAQFAVSTALLVAAGTLLRGYLDAQSAPGAFDSAGVIAVTLDLSQVRRDRPSGTRLYEQALERLSALPGVTGVGLTSDLPMAPGRSVHVVAICGVLAAAGLAATYLPARWASRLEPADILRTD